MRRLRLLLFCLACIMCHAPWVESAEVDTVTATRNFFTRFFHASASSDIDKFVNLKIDQVLVDLNRRQIPCPSNQVAARPVYAAMRRGISGRRLFIGHLIAEDIQTAIPAAKLYAIPLEDSIYNQYRWWMLDGIALSMKGTLAIVKINGVLWGYDFIGMDKLGHFFKEGYEFFDKAYLQHDGSVTEAIEWGQRVEKSYFGELTTGIYSYADIVANFNGMRFWNQLLMFSDDVIDEGPYHSTPFLKCSVITPARNANRSLRNRPTVSWQKGKRFYLNRYADGAWDETNNCNLYKNQSVTKKVLGTMFKVLGEDELLDQTLASEQLADVAPLLAEICPRIATRCRDAAAKYAPFSSELLHPNCLNSR